MMLVLSIYLLGNHYKDGERGLLQDRAKAVELWDWVTTVRHIFNWVSIMMKRGIQGWRNGWT